jgi:hypothetical protein
VRLCPASSSDARRPPHLPHARVVAIYVAPTARVVVPLASLASLLWLPFRVAVGHDEGGGRRAGGGATGAATTTRAGGDDARGGRRRARGGRRAQEKTGRRRGGATTRGTPLGIGRPSISSDVL